MLIGLADNHIDVIASEFAIVCNGVFDKSRAVVAIGLRQGLILLRQVVCGTLDKCWYERKVFSYCLAVCQVEVVIKLVIAAAEAKHCQQVNIC